MNDRSITRSVTVMATASLWLSACNGELAVVDDVDQQGSNLTNMDETADPSSSNDGGDVSTSPTGSACTCARSPSLLALSCGAGVVPLLDNDIVQQTPDGGVAIFNVELPDQSFQVLRWAGGPNASPMASGMLIGSSASGDRILTAPGTLAWVDVDGTINSFDLSMIVGRGSLSAAGDVVVGAKYTDNVGQLVRASVETGAIELLGNVGQNIARAYVTPDASTIVGFGMNFRPTKDNPLEIYSEQAFVWNAAGLTLGLPGVPAGVDVWPEAVSDDGSVIAGRSPSTQQHFRWTDSGDYRELTSSGRSATFLSADGDVVLGSLDRDGTDGAAFRWTEATGVVDLTPGRSSLATAMSDDGNVIVATSWEDAQLDGAAPEDTFIWDVEHGTRTLDEVLAERGVDVSGWEFGHARSLSADGRVLLGRALCGGAPTLYRVVLSD
jgi:hypothetical protein